MTTLATVLNGAAVIATATAPTLGNINRYNAAGGALAVPLPALSGLNVGASCELMKDVLDTTLNAVTFTANSGDTFDNGSTALSLIPPGEIRGLQVISIAGTKYWAVNGGLNPKSGLSANASQVAVTNSTTLTTLATFSLPTVGLAAGSSFRAVLNGTAQVFAGSGTLTFTPNLQGTALAQTTQMASQGSAAGPVGLRLEYVFTIRSTGVSGSAIAKPFGVINFATPAYLFSTSAATTTVNTTAAAGSTVLSVQAQWQTANAANSLLIDTATIERII